MVTFIVLFLLAVFSSGESTPRQYNGLRFGNDRNSYIDFSPDMAHFSERFTVCSWVKRRSSSAHSIWFSYAPTGASNEIMLGDSGLYNYIFGSNSDHRSDFSSVSGGSWFHYCGSWSIASRTWRLYLNGQLIGTHATTSGRTLKLDGPRLVLGNYATVVGGSTGIHIFGGELYKLNMFSKELSASEILEMARGGMCAEVEKHYTSTRQLKWEEIIEQDRNGDVVEFDTGCSPTDQQNELLDDLNVTKSKLNQTLETLEQKESDLKEAATDLETANSRIEEVAGQLNDTLSQLQHTKSALKEVKVQLENTTSQLENTTTQLENTTSQLETTTSQLENTTSQLENTTSQLENTTSQLETTTSQLENATSYECPESQVKYDSPWDVLYTKRFFNKVLTQELLEELRTTWDVLGAFVGVTLSDNVIRHFKLFYEYQSIAGLTSS